jgi:hypothetical protein
MLEVYLMQQIGLSTALITFISHPAHCGRWGGQQSVTQRGVWSLRWPPNKKTVPATLTFEGLFWGAPARGLHEFVPLLNAQEVQREGEWVCIKVPCCGFSRRVICVG